MPSRTIPAIISVLVREGIAGILRTASYPLFDTDLISHSQKCAANWCYRRKLKLLKCIACRVLGDEKKAPIAIQNSWRTASRNPPRFEYEGAFRSWLVTVPIDEALAILRERSEGRAPPLS